MKVFAKRSAYAQRLANAATAVNGTPFTVSALGGLAAPLTVTT